MTTKTNKRKLTRWLVAAAVVVSIPVAFLSNGCSTPIMNRDPTGEMLPTVVGQSLEKEKTELPKALAGKPAVLLVGYKQSTQFDIDRWIMGFIQADLDAQIVEVPTIPGLGPSFASGWIDDGMRAGIPKEDWGSVVTLYGDAAKPIAELTGNENGQVARVLVLDPQGKIVWFDDEGYAPRKAMAIAKLVVDLGRP